MTEAKTGARSRGGQKGNKNAMRHGLYAERISPIENTTLEGMKITELDGEIAFLRVTAARMAEILEHTGLESGAHEPLGDDALKMLAALDRSMTTMLNYIRQYAFQNGDLAELEEDIQEGKDMARIKHNVYNYLEPTEED